MKEDSKQESDVDLQDLDTLNFYVKEMREPPYREVPRQVKGRAQSETP